MKKKLIVVLSCAALTVLGGVNITNCVDTNWIGGIVMTNSSYYTANINPGTNAAQRAAWELTQRGVVCEMYGHWWKDDTSGWMYANGQPVENESRKCQLCKLRQTKHVEWKNQ
jgi:hypothetical protein